MVKDILIFVLGVVLLSPIIVLGFSGSFLGFLAALAWACVLVRSIKYFPRFWIRWWKINATLASSFER